MTLKPNPSDLDHLQWLEDLMVHQFARKSVLDLGCGSGFICAKAMQEGAKAAVGIDIVPPASQDGDWDFQSLNLDSPDWESTLSLPAHVQNFDLILAFDIIEHLVSPYSFLLSCRKLLSREGKLVVTTPNAQSWERYLRPTSWSGVRDQQHKVLFDKYTLKFLLSRVGFEASQITAPVRSLGVLSSCSPQIGGQILCVTS